MLAVLGALFANGLIAILKLVAAVITGSSGMMAEASPLGCRYDKPDLSFVGFAVLQATSFSKHPFGYGKERFFWSFIAAIFIFGVGATYAIYEGIVKLAHPHPPTNLKWAYMGARHLVRAGSLRLHWRFTRKLKRRITKA
jgi:divalent metal cation (Fe/Co/Zn/Cd) transporter